MILIMSTHPVKKWSHPYTCILSPVYMDEYLFAQLLCNGYTCIQFSQSYFDVDWFPLKSNRILDWEPYIWHSDDSVLKYPLLVFCGGIHWFFFWSCWTEFFLCCIYLPGGLGGARFVKWSSLRITLQNWVALLNSTWCHPDILVLGE